jgi:hypothetical protein
MGKRKPRKKANPAVSVKSEPAAETQQGGTIEDVQITEVAEPPKPSLEMAQCPNCKRIVEAKRIFLCKKCGKDGCDRCGWDALTLEQCPNCATEVGG